MQKHVSNPFKENKNFYFKNILRRRRPSLPYVFNKKLHILDYIYLVDIFVLKFPEFSV